MDIQFQEVQYFPEIIFALAIGLLFATLFLWRRLPLPLNLAICVLSFAILLWAFELDIVVDNEAIRTRLGRVPLVQHTIPLDEIIGYKPIGYVALNDHVGVWQQDSAISPFLPKSSRALLLELRDGSRYLIALHKINELQQILEKWRHPK